MSHECVDRRYPGWPMQDRLAWEQATADILGDFLDERPRLAGWALRTQQSARNVVSGFLRWCKGRGSIPTDESLAHIMTPELLLSYIRQLVLSHSHRTAGYNSFLIKGALEVFAPDRDWTWIRTITRRLKIRARREVPSARPVLHAAVLYDLGLQLMRESCSADGDVNPLLYRSGLVVALLAAAPMRIANFAMLEIGRHLRDESGHWTIHLCADETKTRRSDVWPIADRLRASLEYYLEEVRPSLLARARKPVKTARLWIGDSGRPIGDQVLRRLIATLTRERLGTQINPHTFRHCAATTFALERPRDSLQSSALLGHASPQTTEQHYIVQQRQLVQQDYLQILHKRSRCARPSEQ